MASYTILVVDDSLFHRRVAQNILEKEYNLIFASDGKSALENAASRQIDLILLDLILPGMDGFEVFRMLRAQGCTVPVVFLTSEDSVEAEVRGLSEGIDDYIRKPFVAEVMMQRIRRVLELNTLQKKLESLVAEKTAELEERVRKLDLLTIKTMLTLTNAIEAKDHYTKGHSLRVATYAKEIARRCGKAETEQEDIYFTGLLHDIGKIGIPDGIIGKNSRLSDEEYEVIRSHPLIGSNILLGLTEVIPFIADGARWHHERYDGKGYPDGLIGKAIPEIARIISVSDAYDAMTSIRSYRDIMPQAAARAEIVKGIGTQFDPAYAKIMVEMIDDDKGYCMNERNFDPGYFEF